MVVQMGVVRQAIGPDLVQRRVDIFKYEEDSSTRHKRVASSVNGQRVGFKSW